MTGGQRTAAGNASHDAHHRRMSDAKFCAAHGWLFEGRDATEAYNSMLSEHRRYQHKTRPDEPGHYVGDLRPIGLHDELLGASARGGLVR